MGNERCFVADMLLSWTPKAGKGFNRTICREKAWHDKQGGARRLS